MKILLANPRDKKLNIFNRIKYSSPPLNLQILASLTPNEEVEIVDENFDKINFDGDYDLVGLTGYGVSEVFRAKEVYKEFKKRNVPVVIGGPTIFYMPVKDALKYADSTVLGEGEGAWERVVKDVKNNTLKRVYQNKQLVDLSKVETLPRRDMTNNKNYMQNVIEISRGCPNNCDFCLISRFNRGKYRTYPIKRVIRDVEQCLEHPARIKKYISFTDANASIDPDYKIRLFKKLIPYNIAWSSACEISIAKNKKLLNAFSKSGCLSLEIGFESINQESLSSVNKFINKVSEYKKAVKTIHDYGIAIGGNFIIGLDGDKPGVSKKTLDFISDADIDFFAFNIITPIHGTRLFERLEKEGRILTRDLSKYDTEHVVSQPKNMTPQQLEEEYRWLIGHAPKSNLWNLIKRGLTRKRIPNRNVKRSILCSLLFHRLRNNFETLYAKFINRTKLSG